MQQKIIKDLTVGNDDSGDFPLGRFRSLTLKGLVQIPVGADLLATFKITRSGGDSHIFNIADLPCITNLLKGRPRFDIAPGEGVQDVAICATLPFEIDGYKNSLDSMLAKTCWEFAHVNIISGSLKIMLEPTYRKQEYEPYLLPFSLNQDGDQEFIFKRTNVARIFIPQVAAGDRIVICKNGQTVSTCYSDDLEETSPIDARIEEAADALKFECINLTPSELREELNNRASITATKTTSTTMKGYYMGLEFAVPGGSGCGC